MSETARSVSVRAPAKINIALAVGDVRDDGFHELCTLFHAVTLFDRVTAAPSERLVLTVGGTEGATLPADDSNLAWRAAELLARHAGRSPDVALTVHKDIPIAAGLAGGSADAAATLVACNALWRLGLRPEDLAALGAQLGSDVPFALIGGTAIGTGRGERLEPLSPLEGPHWVLAAAAHELATPAVYAELDRLRSGAAAARQEPPVELIAAARTALASADYAALARSLVNDLQPAALSLAPELNDTLRAGVHAGALAGIVSGSGPTCAFLAADVAGARSIAAGLEASGTCRWARPVRGGAPGAVHGTA